MRTFDRVPALGVLATAFFASSCSTTAQVTIDAVGNSPAATFTSGLATVPVGVVLGFEVHAESAAPAIATLDDPTVAEVAPAVQASQFVVIGLATGQTTLHLFVDGQDAAEVTVQVTSPAL